MRLTRRQREAIRRLARPPSDVGGSPYLCPDLAKQLAAKGLVTVTGDKACREVAGKPMTGGTLWKVEPRRPLFSLTLLEIGDRE